MERVIQTVLEEQGVNYRQTLYTPIVAWMSQVLDSDKSLSNAVNRVIAWLAAAERRFSADTGAYSSPQTLALSVLKPLFKRTAEALQAEAGAVVRATGEGYTLVTMSDTSANQASYPQHSNQLVGWLSVGKVVVWFCVTTGAVLEVAMAAFTTSEWKLARQLYATSNQTMSSWRILLMARMWIWRWCVQ